MVVGAAGAVDHEQVVSEVGRRLAKVAAGQAPAAERARYSGGVKLGARDLEQAHLVLGLEGRSYHSPDIYAMQVFANLLGGGMSSRLFQEVSEKRGLCYSISAFHSSFADTGVFGVYSGTDRRRCRRTDARRHRRALGRRRERERSRDRALAGAAQGRAARRARELRRPARIKSRASSWPSGA